MRVVSAEFVAGATSLNNLPSQPENEIAVFGRSNVGKSSFINRITGRKSLARSSSTPGRTKQLNLFSLRVRTETGEDSGVILVDVPGFGYAMFSKAEREDLGRLMVQYIERRKALRVVLLLNDIRRPPEADEFGIRDVAFRNNRNFIVVLTKADKLSKREREKAIKERAAEYGLEPTDIYVTGDGESPAELLRYALGLALQ